MSAATYSLLAPRRERFLPFVMLSVAGHVVVVVLGLVVSWVLAGPRVELDQTPIKATLVRLGKPRDEKLLPRREEAPPPPKQEAEPVPVPAPAAVPIPTKNAKAEKKPAKDERRSLFDALNKTARAAPPEELEGAADGDPNGDAAKQEGERYYALLTSLVKRNYDVSDTIPEAERRTLHAVVAIRVGTSGELLEVHLKKGSGNALFDAAVLSSVKKTAPYPPPPAHLKDGLKSNGIAFDFTP